MKTTREHLARDLDALEDELAYCEWLTEAGRRTIREECRKIRDRMRFGDPSGASVALTRHADHA